MTISIKRKKKQAGRKVATIERERGYNSLEDSDSFISQYKYSNLSLIIQRRMLRNRDTKVMITSKGNTTGLGKTRLATILARTQDKINADLFNRLHTDTYEGWSAEDYGFIRATNYVPTYRNIEAPGKCLLWDEIEIDMDSRRSMTNRQVLASQVWQKLRYKNVVTFCTSPGLWQVDKRVKENTDIWINVMGQGVAYVYYLTTFDDFIGDLQIKRLSKFGMPESIVWLDIDDNDPDVRYMDTLKDNDDFSTERNKITKEDLADSKRTVQKQILKNLYENLGDELSQKEMGELIADGDGGHMSQSWVSETLIDMGLK